MERHTRQEKLEALGRVLDVLDTLRVKCPWDAKQTNESLRPNTIEEVFELCDALIREDDAEIKKELGDVLLHVFFYSKIGEEKGAFDVADVCDALSNKLIYRHPHVYGNVQADDAHQVEQNWEMIKLKEKDGNRSILAGVPSALPALIKAVRIQEKPMPALIGKSRQMYGRKCARRSVSSPQRLPVFQVKMKSPWHNIHIWRRRWATSCSRL